MAGNDEKRASAFKRVLETFRIEPMKESQKEALENLLMGQDVFVIQPTGSGKSLIYQSAPVVFDTIFPLPSGGSITLVISPLTSLM